MIKASHERGVEDALERFGLSKEAGFGAGLKRFLVGDPAKYMKQLRQGTLFSDKGAIRQMMDPRASTTLGTVANSALMYGLPAYGIYQAATSAPGQRGSSVGSAVGGLAGGLLGGPLGLAGQIGGSLLGSSLGEALGRNFNHREHQSVQAAPSAPAPDAPNMRAFAEGRPLRRPRDET